MESNNDSTFHRDGPGDVVDARPGSRISHVVACDLEKWGDDRQAIETLLDTDTKAVLIRNEALFESLLFGKAIPFSGVPLPGTTGDVPATIADYDGSQSGVPGTALHTTLPKHPYRAGRTAGAGFARLRQHDRKGS